MLETLAWVNNRSTNQTKFLFGLCDNDVNKLLKLEAYLKRNFVMSCPSDKETVDSNLKQWEIMRELDKKKK